MIALIRSRARPLFLLLAGALSFVVAGVLAAGPAAAKTTHNTHSNSGQNNGTNKDNGKDKGGGGKTPPGSNGTIKVEDPGQIDQGKDNNPHVGCTFGVSFWGFDVGTRHATVTFYGWPPSGNHSKVNSTPDNSSSGSQLVFQGSGSRKIFDTEQIYTLDLTGLTAQQNQGYHIKVDALVDGSHAHHGQGTLKHKVFWVKPCPPPPGTEVAALNITKSSPAGSVADGGTLTYSINYWNSGNGPANNVVITDTLPAGDTYTSGAVPAPSNVNGQTLTWDIGTVPGNQTDTSNTPITVPVTVSAIAPGCSESNVATISADGLNDVTSEPAVNAVTGGACATTVLGEHQTKPGSGSTAKTTPATKVLGTTISRSLPFTGPPKIGVLVASGLGLMLLGLGLVDATRRRRAVC